MNFMDDKFTTGDATASAGAGLLMKRRSGWMHPARIKVRAPWQHGRRVGRSGHALVCDERGFLRGSKRTVTNPFIAHPMLHVSSKGKA